MIVLHVAMSHTFHNTHTHTHTHTHKPHVHTHTHLTHTHTSYMYNHTSYPNGWCWCECWSTDHPLHQVQRSPCVFIPCQHLFPRHPPHAHVLDPLSHVASSWTDRGICRWVSVGGGMEKAGRGKRVEHK